MAGPYMGDSTVRQKILKFFYRLYPFDLRGDIPLQLPCDGIRISCIINFFGRLDLLAGIMFSLAEQNYPKHLYEVILVEDKGGTESGKQMAEEFSSFLPIIYATLDKKFGNMGYSRNFGLSRSRGEIILFLDDDTVILQKNFLERLDRLFIENKGADAVIPHGRASFSIIEGRYAYHDPYFMTSRCTAYRRAVLSDLGGFIADFVGQEDVEFVIRFMMAGKQPIKGSELEYYHPPLLVPNLRKPKAVGCSFYNLKSRYPFFLWLLVLLNCARHAPLYLLPGRKNKEMGRFGFGFLVGVITAVFNKEGYQYN